MYTTIRVVVEAHDSTDAVEAAELFFTDHLMHIHSGPFDHCRPVVEDQDSDAHESESGDETHVAFPLDSEQGQAEVTDAWERTRERMAENIEPAVERIQALCESHDTTDDAVDSFLEVLLHEEDFIKHNLSKACGYDSTDYLLYVQQWSTHGISSYAGWQHIQKLISEQQTDDLDTDGYSDIEPAQWWVVPLSVHY